MVLGWVMFFAMQALQQTAHGKEKDSLDQMNQSAKAEASNACFKLGVIGGDKITIEQAPYMAALFKGIYYSCGGSLIHDQFVMTSAYCCAPQITRVHMGSDNVDNGGAFINVVNTLMHENYNNVTMENDICLLKLERSLPYVQRIYVAHDQFHVNDGTMVNITGWGLMSRDDNYPDDLNQATISVVSEQCCREMNPIRPATGVLCAGSRGRNFCDGDVGGPLTYRNVQIGIASSGPRAPCGDYPAFYTKVSSFYHWIIKTINNNL